MGNNVTVFNTSSQVSVISKMHVPCPYIQHEKLVSNKKLEKEHKLCIPCKSLIWFFYYNGVSKFESDILLYHSTQQFVHVWFRFKLENYLPQGKTHAHLYCDRSMDT